MVNNTDVHLREKKQDVSGDENFLHFGLKTLCFAGLFPYEKICNSPRKLKLYRAYQISLYVLYCPILLSQIVQLCLTSENLQQAIETVAHIQFGVGTYLVPAFINWNELYKLICELDTSIKSKISNQNDRKKKILRETKKKCTFISLSVIILAMVLMFCDLYDIFILHFVENIVGVEHIYKRNADAANIFESLLVEKYPFSCWTPFGEKSVPAHLAVYLYTAIPVFMAALRAGSVVFILVTTTIHISLQFKFVSKSLDDLSNMENFETQVKENAFSTPDKQHTCEESNYRNIQVSATGGESFHTPNQPPIPECSNNRTNTDKTTTAAHCIKDQEHEIDFDRLPSNDKSSPEDCVITIIKSHQEAFS
jgi:hypothetical protein